ncbi:MAG: hypothetical protein NTV51_32205, partial [Verrucomicrobia bacterium]|nr:hypothetical protein [Verrucomicrobiota bacterium]
QRGRGGVLQNFRFDNWVIEGATKFAFEINTRYSTTPDAPLNEKTPVFRNFSYSNISIINAAQIAKIVGLPEKAIGELRFSDINATGKVGFLVELADDLELHHVRLAATSGSPLVLTQASNVVLDDVSSRPAKPTLPAIAATDSSDVVLRNSRASADTGTFLRVAGPKTAGIVVSASDLSRAKTDVELAPDAPAQAVSRK